MDKTEKREFYTTGELAKLLGISRVAVFKKIKSGEIKAKKAGRNFLIPAEYISEALEGILTPTSKREIEKTVDKVVSEYGETLKLLGRE